MMKNSTTTIKKKSSHIPFIDTIQCGDSARFLKQIPDNSIDLVITSPPYFQQREYAGGATGSERLVENYLDAIMDVFHECVRVTKNCGSIVFNMGDKYENGNLLLVPYRFAIHATNMEKVKLVNNITWIKTNPTPRQFKKRLVSSTEPFFHFVKTDKYYYDLDTFQSINNNKTKQHNTITKRTTIGNKYRNLIKNSKLTPKQKKYAIKELDKVISETKEKKITGFRMKIRGIHSIPFGGQSGGRQIQLDKNGFTIIRMRGNTLKKDVITSSVESLKWNKHPAIYPESIISEIIKLLSCKGSVILDPYMGSGTTGASAKKLGRHFIGVDINPEYCDIAIQRITSINFGEML
jgi:site-specific DNA-methyltransferase (adenine-specific)